MGGRGSSSGSGIGNTNNPIWSNGKLENPTVALFYNYYDEEKLEYVKEDMKIMGRPEIKVIETEEGDYIALEGTHRLRAAKELGITPKFKVVKYDKVENKKILDLVPDSQDSIFQKGYTVEKFRLSIQHNKNTVYIHF